MEQRKFHDRDFKFEAVKLGLERGLFRTSKELGIAPSNMSRWRKELQKYGTESFCGSGHFRSPEQKKFSELKKTLKQKLKESELQVEIFKKASKHIAMGKPMIFQFIEENLDRYPLWQMCKALGIRAGTYHKWKNNVISPRQHQTILLEQEITSIFYEFKEIYGNGKIAAELQSRGFKLSIPQVTHYMRKLSLTSKVSRIHKGKCNSLYNPCIFPNRLNRQFKVEESSRVWVSSITSIATTDCLIYLTAIMDLFDRKIIGWSVSDGLTIMETSLVAWEIAVHSRKTKEGLLFHSDRGPQYANKVFTRKLNSYKEIRRSMSRKGNYLDNIIIKSFFNKLKSEIVHPDMLLPKAKMAQKLHQYIESYNDTSYSAVNCPT